MAATVVINRLTGSGPTKTVISGGTTRFHTADTGAADTNTPLPIPTSGTTYSYWCATRLECTSAPALGINNIKWYTDGANGFGTGISLKVQTATGYVQATGTSGTTGNILNTTNYSTLAGATVNAFTYTSGSPLSVSGTLGATTGDFGDYVVSQLEAGTTSLPGPTPAESMTFRYDEF